MCLFAHVHAIYYKIEQFTYLICQKLLHQISFKLYTWITSSVNIIQKWLLSFIYDVVYDVVYGHAVSKLAF